MDPSFPPFENLDVASGEVVGLDAGLARALGDELQIRTEIISLGFDELLDAVAAHRVDAAISALPVIPERTEDVRFSEPYVQAGVMLAVRGGSPVAGPADLTGKRVAVEWGSQGDAEARRLLVGDEESAERRFELLPKETVTAALDALVAGEADAAIVDAISLALYPQTGQLTTVGEPLLSDPYVVVVAYDAPDLLRAVNDALRRLEADGTLNSLRGRWLRPQ
jgi:ABC-type amino acid transport substrate-binding protein